jgi:GNAT superfamily N-acetyltransferase
MQLQDVEQALDWAAAEGWNPGLKDAEPFYLTDPDGFLVGELGGVPIGCISAVRYGDAFGFIGFYIVQPPWRGQGYGIQLWRAALQHLGDRTIGLDGVVAQIANYQTFGFKTAYRHVRYEGIGNVFSLDAADGALVPLTQIPFSTILACDRPHFPAERAPFLQAWLQHYPGYGFMQSGMLRGYGVVRPTRNGFKIGPLFANDPTIADALFRALAQHALRQPLFLDIPDANPGAIALVQRYGMTPVFECARMYTQTPPSIKLQQVFGVTTLELG